MTQQLFVQASLAYHFAQEAEVLLRLEAARTPAQTILKEALVIDPAAPVVRLDDDETGERRVVFKGLGNVELRYSALIDLNPEDHGLAGAEQHHVSDLPPEALSFLLPSRYCPAERFEAYVQKEFGRVSGGDKVLAIQSWIGTNLEYRAGTSNEQSTAIDTFTTRAGVCRDFAHLAVSFCRAAGIPARVVSAHAFQLQPPDMHAVAEVFVGGRWRLFDPTGLAPLDGLIRVAAGRDAGDIAFMTIFGQADLVAQTFAVTDLKTLAA